MRVEWRKCGLVEDGCKMGGILSWLIHCAYAKMVLAGSGEGDGRRRRVSWGWGAEEG